MGGNTNNWGEILMGGVTRDVSDVSAADAQVRQFPFAEAFKLSDGLVVGEPSLNLCENKRHQHGHDTSVSVRLQVGPEKHVRKRLIWHGPSPVLSNTDDPERFRKCSCEERARVCCTAVYRSEHMTYA
jgi:hypothetical protein